jgi:hypothetical protein
MPLDFQPVQIVLEGLDQKTDAKMRAPGKLASAINVEFDKVGTLNKRRGYRRVVMTEIHGEGVESVFCNVATFQGELLVYGAEYLYAVASITAAVDGASLAVRGPVLRGNCGVTHIASSTLSEEQVT